MTKLKSAVQIRSTAPADPSVPLLQPPPPIELEIDPVRASDHLSSEIEDELPAAGGGDLDVAFGVVVVVGDVHLLDRLGSRDEVAAPDRFSGGDFFRIEEEDAVRAGDDDARRMVRRRAADGDVLEAVGMIVRGEHAPV